MNALTHPVVPAAPKHGPLRMPVPARGAELDFVLPPELEADRPPEARGLPRDGVRLMVSSRDGASIAHTEFRRVPQFLRPGDLLLINTSGTLPAALPAALPDHSAAELHLSTKLPDGGWTVELRLPTPGGTVPFLRARAGDRVLLPDGGAATLRAPHRPALGRSGVRIWDADLRLPGPLPAYVTAYGQPIRYGYVREPWPIACYQTVFANEPGSAEMPSAGRAFTPELVAELVARGVQFAPLLLHTGVSSLEDHEPPYEEYFRVPAHTARIVNETRAAGGRIIAVGTTAVRAIETAAGSAGLVHAAEGWTDVVIARPRGVRAVDGLLTGLHEPRASHLAMLEAIAGRAHIAAAYAEALRERYLWHEFGDLHLILP